MLKKKKNLSLVRNVTQVLGQGHVPSSHPSRDPRTMEVSGKKWEIQALGTAQARRKSFLNLIQGREDPPQKPRSAAQLTCRILSLILTIPKAKQLKTGMRESHRFSKSCQCNMGSSLEINKSNLRSLDKHERDKKKEHIS